MNCPNCGMPLVSPTHACWPGTPEGFTVVATCYLREYMVDQFDEVPKDRRREGLAEFLPWKTREVDSGNR